MPADPQLLPVLVDRGDARQRLRGTVGRVRGVRAATGEDGDRDHRGQTKDPTSSAYWSGGAKGRN